MKIQYLTLSIAVLLFMPAFSPLVSGTGECPVVECPSMIASYSGRAAGAVIITDTEQRFGDTGELPPEGGEVTSQGEVVSDTMVQAEVFSATSRGQDNIAQSEASAAGIVMLAGTENQISADFVWASSWVDCNGVAGFVTIENLVVGGESVFITGETNQFVSVPGVFDLVINEQIDSSTDIANEITVNALHLIMVSGGEVIVASARSDIACTCGEVPPPGEEPQPRDFVTGGGFIYVDGSKANFGFNAGFKPNQDLRGNFNYIDHSIKMHVKSESITSYTGFDNTRTFGGDATASGEPVTFSVTVTDNGEPGRGSDTFEIQLSNGYSASGVLGGGNIQLHT